MPLDELGHGVASALRGEVALGDPGLLELQARRRQGLFVAAQAALCGVEVERPGDGRDLSAALPQKVGHGAAGSADVVGVDVADVLLPRAATQQYGRQPGFGEHVRQSITGVHGHQQDPVDPSAARVLEEALPLGVRADQGQQQLDPGVCQRVSERADDLGEEGLGELPPVRLRHDQRDGVGPAPRQGTGREIGHVAEFLDGPLYVPTRRLLHARRVVDDAGDRAPSHPRVGGHLLQRRCPRASPAHDHLPPRDHRSYRPEGIEHTTSPVAWLRAVAPQQRLGALPYGVGGHGCCRWWSGAELAAQGAGDPR